MSGNKSMCTLCGHNKSEGCELKNPVPVNDKCKDNTMAQEMNMHIGMMSHRPLYHPLAHLQGH